MEKGRKKYKSGLIEIAGVLYDASKTLPENVRDMMPSEFTIKRHLDGYSEKPRAKHQKNWMRVNSVEALINSGWNLRGIKGIAEETGYCTRHVKRLIKAGLPNDKLFGRFYSCTNSVWDWIEKRRS